MIHFLCCIMALLSCVVATIRTVLCGKSIAAVATVAKEEAESPEGRLEIARFVSSVSDIYKPVAVFVAIQELYNYAKENA